MSSTTAALTLSLCSSFSTHCRLSPSPSPSPLNPLSLSLSKSNSLSLSSKHQHPHKHLLKASSADSLTAESQVEAQVADAEKPPKQDVFAVVMVGSRQYIVFPGRFLVTQRLKGASANDKIVLNKVLFVGTKTHCYIGKPVVTNAAVHAVVEEQLLDKKVIVFKYKKKKNYRRKIGHRQPITRIRITGITGFEDYPASALDQ